MKVNKIQEVQEINFNLLWNNLYNQFDLVKIQNLKDILETLKRELKKENLQIQKFENLDKNKYLLLIQSANNVLLNSYQQLKNDNTQLQNNNSYEQMLQKLESEVRNHIKVQHQLKLYSESLQQKIDESELKIKQYEKQQDGSKKVQELEKLLQQKDYEINNYKQQVMNFQDYISNLKSQIRNQKVSQNKDIEVQIFKLKNIQLQKPPQTTNIQINQKINRSYSQVYHKENFPSTNNISGNNNFTASNSNFQPVDKEVIQKKISPNKSLRSFNQEVSNNQYNSKFYNQPQFSKQQPQANNNRSQMKSIDKSQNNYSYNNTINDNNIQQNKQVRPNSSLLKNMDNFYQNLLNQTDYLKNNKNTYGLY